MKIVKNTTWCTTWNPSNKIIWAYVNGPYESVTAMHRTIREFPYELLQVGNEQECRAAEKLFNDAALNTND
jgi:hypothetical protein